MRNVVVKRRLVAVALFVNVCAVCVAQEPAATAAGDDEKLARVLKGLGESVERYHAGLFIKVGPFGRVGPSRKLRYTRDDFTVRFRRVEFKDPPQTLLLPESAEWVRVIEGASRPRVRIRQTFADYRRYVSDVKVIEDAGPDK